MRWTFAPIVALCFTLAPRTHAQFQIEPIHPVIGNVEAVGAGDFGVSIIKLRHASPAVVQGYGGFLRIQFFDVSGQPIGGEAWVRPEDYRTINVTCAATAFGNSVFQNVNQGEVIEIRTGQYIRDAGPAAYCFDVRIYQGATVSALTSSPDGLPGIGDDSDLLDKRFQIIRQRALATSATVQWDPLSSDGVLKVSYSIPPAGPGSDTAGTLRTGINYSTPAPECFAGNPCDTDPNIVPPESFEVYHGNGWRLLTEQDVASVSVLPGSSEIVMIFDRKFSVLENASNPNYMGIRATVDSLVRDAWGQRVRSTVIPIYRIQCPNLPSTFNLYSPTNGQIDLPQQPDVKWEPASCVTLGYRVDIATDSSFSNVVYSTPSGLTEFVMPPNVLQPGTKYYWRVFALNANGQTGAIQNGSWFATRVPGDVNGDGRVDSADLSVMLGNFGAIVP